HSDTLELALATHVSLKGSEDRQHAIEGASRCGRGIDALLDDFEVGPCLLDLVSNIGEVPHGASQPVQPRDNERVAFTQDGEDLLQLGAAVALRAARLLLENGPHPSALQRLALQGEVLVRGRDPCVTKQLSGPLRCRLGLLLPRLHGHPPHPPECPISIWSRPYVSFVPKSTLIGRISTSDANDRSGYTQTTLRSRPRERGWRALELAHLAFGLIEPERHVHFSVHRRRNNDVLLSLLALARASVEFAEAEVAVGD